LPSTLTTPLPLPRRRQLSNGVVLVELDLPQAPLVCLDFWCRAGSASETGAESGLAHFLEHMVFKGSEQLPAGAFDRRIEALGGSSNAATGFDDVHYHVLIPPEAAAEALELLLELVLKPRLAEHDFAMERQVVLEELAQSEDQPEDVAFQELLRRACADHAYGLPILGRREAPAWGPSTSATTAPTVAAWRWPAPWPACIWRSGWRTLPWPTSPPPAAPPASSPSSCRPAPQPWPCRVLRPPGC
jgi:predicted Zn-dependent peptidase